MKLKTIRFRNKYSFILCKDGPFKGKKIQRNLGQTDTLIFSIGGKSGYYTMPVYGGKATWNNTP